MKTKLKWSFSNKKVTKLDAVSFGIPAYESDNGFKTCPKAGACAAVCYARQGTYTWPVVKAAREFNLTIARLDLEAFKRHALDDLKRIKQTIIRVHDSGDFFNQEYLNAWIDIARANPTKLFYAYTKSLHLDFSAKPSNLRITQSVGGLLDDKIDTSQSHARIFSSVEARETAGYLDGNIDDTLAIEGQVKIGLVYHGVKKLTDNQRGFFV